MKSKRWTSNKPVIEASDKRLSNGVLGRLRGKSGENVKLSQLEELAQIFGVAPHELLAPAADAMPVASAQEAREPGAQHQAAEATIGALVLQLATAARSLDGRKLRAVEEAVLRMLQLGPDQTEAQALDWIVAGLTPAAEHGGEDGPLRYKHNHGRDLSGTTNLNPGSDESGRQAVEQTAKRAES